MEFSGSLKQVTGKPTDDAQCIQFTVQVEAIISQEQFAEAGKLLSKTVSIDINPLQPSLDMGDEERKNITRLGR